MMVQEGNLKRNDGTRRSGKELWYKVDTWKGIMGQEEGQLERKVRHQKESCSGTRYQKDILKRKMVQGGHL
jgi:hypothetical protein